MTSEFRVIPAIDLLGEGAVSLEQGDFGRVRARRDPFELVERFAAAGSRLLHVVDLDGARSGRLRPRLIARIVEAARPAAVQASGGIRSLDDAERLLEAGAVRIVVGTAAFADPDALERYATALGDRLVVAVDARDGRLALAGWLDKTDIAAGEAAALCAAAGVARILCTSIARDGTLAGPDLDLLRTVRDRSRLPVIAAGGIGSEAGVEAVRRAGCEGAIMGRAILEGAVPLSLLAPVQSHRQLGPHNRRRRRCRDRGDQRVAARVDVEDVLEREAPRLPRAQLTLGDHQHEGLVPTPAVALAAAGLEHDITLLTRRERQRSSLVSTVRNREGPANRTAGAKGQW